jgi:hypothetical protein
MGKEPQLYKLKLTSLKYVSSVDTPAQETAIARLLKRGTGLKIATTARVAKLSDELGLVFGWALTTKAAGAEYYDLQGDNVLEDDLIKVAAEWMSGGGAADTMHDREQDGRAIFCMPMTTEVAKAVYGDKIGGELGTYGLLVAIKPSVEDFAKFKSGELTGFSIDGTGERTATKTRTRKGDDKRYLTDEALGHQHEAHSYDGQEPWMSDATAEGAQGPHRHIVVRQPDGSLSVLADSGHTHTLTEQPKVIVVPDDATAVSEDVAARAPQESPPAAKSQNVINKDTTMDPTKELADLKALNEKLQARIAELEAQTAEAKSTAELTDGEKAHLATLAGGEAKRFRALEKSARIAEVTKARESDPVVATIDGVEYRKSTPGSQLAVKLAEQIEKTESVELEKQATAHMGNLAGDKADHIEIIRAIHAHTKGNLEKRAKLLTVVDGANAIAKSRTKAAGFDGADGKSDADPMEALTKGLTKFCAEQKIDKVWTVGLEKFKRTDEGAALNDAVNEALTQ